MATFPLPPQVSQPRRRPVSPLSADPNGDAMRDMAARVRAAQQERMVQEAARREAERELSMRANPSAPLPGQVGQALQNHQASQQMQSDPEAAPAPPPDLNPWDQAGWAERLEGMREGNRQARQSVEWQMAEPMTAPTAPPDDSIDADDIETAQANRIRRELEADYDEQVQFQADLDARRAQDMDPIWQGVEAAIDGIPMQTFHPGDGTEEVTPAVPGIQVDVPIPEPMNEGMEPNDVAEAGVKGEAESWNRESEPKPMVGTTPKPVAESRPEDLSPLPGEETLTNLAIAWGNANPGGMDKLKIAWMLEKNRGGKHDTFESWLAANGGESGQAGVFDDLLKKAESYIAGNSKYKTYSLNEDGTLKSEDSQLWKDKQGEIAGRKFVRESTKRHRGELEPAAVESLYNAGLSAAKERGLSGTEAHSFAVQHANKAGFNAARDMNLWKRNRALDQQRDQYSRAQRYGMTVGQVAIMDGLQDATTPWEMARQFSYMHQQNPGMGWDNMAARAMQGGFDMEAVKEWARNTVGEKRDFSTDVNAFQQSPYDVTRFSRLMDMARKVSGPEAKPEDLQQQARQMAASEVGQLISGHISGAPMNANQQAYVSQVVGNLPWDQFIATFGLAAHRGNPELRQWYKRTTGQEPRNWNEFWGAAGNQAGQAAAGIGTHLFNGLFGGGGEA